MKKIYKARLPYIFGNSVLLVFPLLLTIVNFAEVDGVQRNESIGLISFWLLAMVITLAPFVFKLEVGVNYVKTYFFGFPIRTVEVSNVQVLEYGNLFRGGLGFGKGLKMWIKTGRGRKYFSIGEKAYGKEAITHIREVLGKNLPSY